MLENEYEGLNVNNVYEGLNARSEVYLSRLACLLLLFEFILTDWLPPAVSEILIYCLTGTW